MKQLLKLLPVPLITVSTLVAAPEDRTAKAIKAKAETLAGQQVSVEVTHVAWASTASTNECSIFIVHTFDTGEDLPAGSILVAVDKGQHDSFVDKFGATPDVGAKNSFRKRETKRLTGPLRLTSRKIPYIDLSNGLAAEAYLAKAATEADQPGAGNSRQKIRNALQRGRGRQGPPRK
jgi:hypothetical protein